MIAATDPRRGVPALDALLLTPALQQLGAEAPRAVLTECARAVLAEERTRLAEAGEGAAAIPHGLDDLADQVAVLVRHELAPTLRPVLNATGVVLHTNLGRAPLSAAALAAVAAVAGGYSTLEYDIGKGERGSRHTHAERLLCRVTGAEAACVVNNCAAGLVLALTALARRREVVVSRGQAVEIGGGFRVPDVMRQSGALLVDVGTTNRTRASDYAEAITPRTAALLRVHRSNFSLQGFVEDTSLEEMAGVAHSAGILLIDDLGGGCLLDARPLGLSGEPLVGQSVAAGADLVLFSGDKLLGGPQAGIIVGRAAPIAALRKHSLMRALRVDKMTLAALQATLLHYARGEALREVPIWRMISATPEDLAARATRLAAAVMAGMPDSAGTVRVGVAAALSTVGGGSLPGQTLPTTVLTLGRTRRGAGGATARLAAALRGGQPAVVGRVEGDQVVLDPRTIEPERDAILAQAVIEALRVSAAGDSAR